MTPRSKKYLADMLEKARFLVGLRETHDLGSLGQERVLCAAVERELMILGEALFLLNQSDPVTPSPRPGCLNTERPSRCGIGLCTVIRR